MSPPRPPASPPLHSSPYPAVPPIPATAHEPAHVTAAEAADALTITMSSAIASSIVISVASSVASSLVVTASTAVAGSAGATAAASGASSAGGGGGGTVVPLVLGVQRFSASGGLGCGLGPVQQGVASSMGWLSGELDFISHNGTSFWPRGLGGVRSRTVSVARRRQLQGGTGATGATTGATGTGASGASASEASSGDADGTSPVGSGAPNATELLDEVGEAAAADDDASEAPLPLELITLLNILITTGSALVLTLLVQLGLVLTWRHRCNRRFYEERARKGSSGGTTNFVPFPKSLVWPNALFFVVCIFGFGLTRASVRLLAAQPAGCDGGCLALPAVVLALLLLIVGIAALDVLRFYARYGDQIHWKPAKSVEAPEKIVDPLTRLSARVRVRLIANRIFLRHRAPRLSRRFDAVVRLSRRAPALLPRISRRTPARVQPAPPEAPADSETATHAVHAVHSRIDAPLPDAPLPDSPLPDAPSSTPTKSLERAVSSAGASSRTAESASTVCSRRAPSFAAASPTALRASPSSAASSLASERLAPASPARTPSRAPSRKAPICPDVLAPRSDGTAGADAAASLPAAETRLAMPPRSGTLRLAPLLQGAVAIEAAKAASLQRQPLRPPPRLPRPSSAGSPAPSPRGCNGLQQAAAGSPAPSPPTSPPASPLASPPASPPASAPTSPPAPSPPSSPPASPPAPVCVAAGEGTWEAEPPQALLDEDGEWQAADSGMPLSPIGTRRCLLSAATSSASNGAVEEGADEKGADPSAVGRLVTRIRVPPPPLQPVADVDQLGLRPASRPRITESRRCTVTPAHAAAVARNFGRQLTRTLTRTLPLAGMASTAPSNARVAPAAMAGPPARSCSVTSTTSCGSSISSESSCGSCGSCGSYSGAHKDGAPEAGDAPADAGHPRPKLSFKEAREAAIRALAARGLRDRRSGAWVAPEADTAEPARTERLLRDPFALRRPLAGDALHQREGFLLFRVNGSSRVGVAYRLLVIVVMMGIGVLSGLQPLMGDPLGVPALLQTLLVLGLQLVMATLCFCFLPDADRVISRFAGAQFCLEALATAALLGASRSDEAQAAGWQDAALALSLSAMSVPILVVIEMRLITPLVLLMRNRTGQRLALCAAAYMLGVGLYRGITKMMLATAAAGADESGTDDAEASEPKRSAGAEGRSSGATADNSEAGADGHDEAAQVSHQSSRSLAFDGGGGTEEDGAGDMATGAQVDAGQITQDAVLKASGLVARAAAAKEVDVKKLATMPEPAMAAGTRLRIMGHAQRMAGRTTDSARRTRFQDDVDVDAEADADVDGADDGGD